MLTKLVINLFQYVINFLPSIFPSTSFGLFSTSSMLSLAFSPLVISSNIDLFKINVSDIFEIIRTKRNCDCHESIKQQILIDDLSNNLYTVFLRKLLESKQCGLGATRTTDPQSVLSNESLNDSPSCGLLSGQMIGSDRSTMTGSNNETSESQPWLTDVTTGNIRNIPHGGGMLQLPSSSVCGAESGPLFPNQSGTFRPTMPMLTPPNLASQQQRYAPQFQSHFPSIGGSNLSLYYRQSHMTYPPVYTHYRPQMSGTTPTIVPGNQYIQVEPFPLLSSMQNVVSYTQPHLPHSSAIRANPLGSRDTSSYSQFQMPDKNREETNSILPYSSLISKQEKQLSKSPSLADKDAKSTQVNRTLRNEQTSFIDPNVCREKGLITMKTQSLSSSTYQIPSGKEGSLKHRILRPPQNIDIIPSSISVINEAPHSAPPIARDRSKEVTSPKQARYSTSVVSKHEPTYSLSHQSSLNQSAVISTRSHLHHPTYFTKGSIIQLANGHLKQVEELTTNDFVESAALSTNLSMDQSTVVKIKEIPESGLAVLGFSVGLKQVQVTVEAPLEHPFFIFNQGWSSCSPEQSQQRYRLTCSKLKVGDICISLTHKNTQTSGQSLPSYVCDSKPVLVPNSVANPNQSAIFLPLQKFHSHDHKKSDNTVCHTPDSLHSDKNASQVRTTRKRRWSAPDQFSF
ncbi:uncharacterized protein LOC111617891 isoform X1 [Centruroides sculpturatus]|uniref:uncharacterized protein LOC111617891 isoform X1 n=2 Tax=Centruroides sculpturatus TaxID=218467 RepID=UPI000C6E1244|nr:uncharacterized protein LOC111617891 isoform X1 [Centruroides sculpturatus]